MKCKTCKHWSRLIISDQFLPEAEIGTCNGLLGNDYIEIELKTGHDGGYVDTIETRHNFYCAIHEVK